MFSKFLTPVLAGLMLTSATLAGAQTQVQEINVTMDLTAVSNAAAAVRFANVANDLQGAIAARLVDRIAEQGVRINIDLSEIELSNSYTEMVGSADTRLVGQVNVSDERDNSNFDAYKLTVDVNQAMVFFPRTVDMTTLAASSDEYYTSLIRAFARNVVDRLDR